MPVLERNGASYDLLVATTQNIDRENDMMNRRVLVDGAQLEDLVRNGGYVRNAGIYQIAS